MNAGSECSHAWRFTKRVKFDQIMPYALLVLHADIGANLTDAMFKGEYHGKSYHAPDLDAVLQRAYAAGA